MGESKGQVQIKETLYFINQRFLLILILLRRLEQIFVG
jgi:hypothetical protein